MKTYNLTWYEEREIGWCTHVYFVYKLAQIGFAITNMQFSNAKLSDKNCSGKLNIK